MPALGAPLEIRDVPVPEPGAGQIVVRIEASGLCHTDIHAARGEWPVKPKDQLIPGHEGVGIVEAVGSPGLPVAVGQRVALPWLVHDLTTVDQGAPERGRLLGDLTRRVLAGEPVEDVVLPTRLHVGTTTGPLRTRC